jgi:hypothetical protein
MQKLFCVLVAALIVFDISAPARAGVSCSPQASGVAGVIANQEDVIGAVNCLGQQLAELRSGAMAADRVQTARIEVLARQIAALQFSVDQLSRRIANLEANASDFQRPLATRPW